MDKKGRFIVIEGIDGAGKSTLVKKLDSYLTRRNINYICTREPTDWFYETRKKGKLTFDDMQNLFVEDRTYHVNDEILPALQSGKWVICDRYKYSHTAYGSVYDNVVNKKENISTFNEKYYEHGKEFIEADLIIYLNVDPKTGFSRQETGDVVPLDTLIAVHKLYEYVLDLAAKDGCHILSINVNNRCESEVASEAQVGIDWFIIEDKLMIR